MSVTMDEAMSDSQPTLPGFDPKPISRRPGSGLWIFVGIGAGLAVGLIAAKAPGVRQGTRNLVLGAPKAPSISSVPVRADRSSAQPESATKAEPPKEAPAKPADPAKPVAKMPPSQISPTQLSPMPVTGGPIGLKSAPPGFEPPAEAPQTLVRWLDMNLSESLESKVRAMAGVGVEVHEIAAFVGEKRTAYRALLLSTDREKTDSVEKALVALGATTGLDWRGAASDRERLMGESATLALRDLKAKREQLLERYFEDAIPVKEVDDQIAEAQKALAGAHLKGASEKDAIRLVLISG